MPSATTARPRARANNAKPPEPLSEAARQSFSMARAMVKDADEVAGRANDPDLALAVLSGVLGIIYALEGVAISLGQHQHG